MKKLSIAIDGPAAAGKSTVAKLVAEHFHYIYIDTGAMYRALAYAALARRQNIEDEGALLETLLQMNISLVPSKEGQLVYINDEEVTSEIRSQEVTNSVSIVAKHPAIRIEMVKRQREMAADGGIVMDGRDIGTHVLPDAELKVYLLASVEERAERRYKENVRKGFTESLEKLREEIAKRDQLDMEREISPLKKADDAIELDTTSMRIEEVVEKIIALAKERV